MSLYPSSMACWTELAPPQGFGKALEQVWSVKECEKSLKFQLLRSTKVISVFEKVLI